MDILSDITKTFSSYSPTANTWALQMVANATGRIALQLITVFIVMELMGFLQRAEDQGSVVTLAQWGRFAWRVGYASLFTATSTAFLQVILSAANKLSTDMGKTMGGALNLGATLIPNISSGGSSIASFLAGGVSALVGNSIVAALAVLVQLVAYISIFALLGMRMFAMFIMLIFAPLAMSTLVLEKYQYIAINYLKKFAGYALQGAMIVVVLGLYTMIINGITSVLPTGWLNIAGVSNVDKILSALVESAILIITLWQSHRFANDVFGG